MSESPSSRVLLIAPSPPPYGGMAIQARLLETLLRGDGRKVVFFASNLPLPGVVRWFSNVPCVRTAIRTCLIWASLPAKVRAADVVHIFAASWVYCFAVVCPAVLYGRILRKRVVLNYRGGDARQFFRVYGWLVAPIFSLADVVTAPSQFLGRIIRERFGVPVAIVRNVLKSSVFTYRERTVFRPKILVTRHLEKIYDVESAIRAFRIVQERHPEARLRIAGTGQQAMSLRELVKELNLSNVEFLGHVPHDELGAIYQECDILLNASRVDNFPGALLEASGAGLVIVSTGAGGIPDMYEHEKSALLVAPGDWNALAEAVIRVVESPELARALAAHAAGLAEECQWPKVRRELYKAYNFPLDRLPAKRRRAAASVSQP